MGGPIGGRNNSVQQHKKSEKKWEKDLKAIKKQNKILYRHHGVQRYCVLCNKAGMPELKYASHSAEDFTSMRNNFNNQGWNGRTYWR